MKNKSNRIIRAILFVLLTGIFPLIALWKNNLGQIPSSVVVKPLLFTALVVLLVFGFWLLLLRSLEKAAVLGFLTSIFIFSYGHIYNLISTSAAQGMAIGFVKLFAICFAVYLVLVILVIRLKRIPDALFLFGNIAAGALIVLNLVPIVQYSLQVHQSEPPKAASPAVQASTTADRPDIYFIILDSYARQDVLEQVIGVDNSSFIAALKQRGFYIPDCAFSNYEGTMSALMSILNSAYLDELNVPIKDIEKYLGSNVNLILKNKAAETFRSYGYQFVTGRGYSSFLDIEDSDLYLNYFKDSGGKDDLAEKGFTNLYLNTTLFRLVSELYKNNPEKFSWLPYWLSVDRGSDPYLKEASFWYYQNLYMFDSLEKIPDMPGDYFVYAHINAPHAPYVFRSDGSLRYPLDTEDVKVLYADSLTYINKRVLELVDVLQKKSAVPPIIIIQGDHSIHMLTAGLDKHKILSAYYLPGQLSTPPYATITPVNDFPLILKNYFDPSTKLLPDTLWVKYKNEPEAVASSCDLTP